MSGELSTEQIKLIEKGLLMLRDERYDAGKRINGDGNARRDVALIDNLVSGLRISRVVLF